MRYNTECREQKKFFGFFARITEGPESALYDRTYDRAILRTGKRALSYRGFLIELMNHYLATTESTAETQ
jgi:hypothetical protein